MEKILEVNRYGVHWILETNEDRIKDTEEKPNLQLCLVPKEVILPINIKKKFIRFRRNG